jgi:hypothetical protein
MRNWSVRIIVLGLSIMMQNSGQLAGEYAHKIWYFEVPHNFRLKLTHATHSLFNRFKFLPKWSANTG